MVFLLLALYHYNGLVAPRLSLYIVCFHLTGLFLMFPAALPHTVRYQFPSSQRCTQAGVSEWTPAGVLTIFENGSGAEVDFSKEGPEPEWNWSQLFY